MQRTKQSEELNLVSEKGNRIITIDDLKELHGIDERIREVFSQEPNVWEVAMNKKDGSTEVVQLHQLKAKFRMKIQPVILSIAEILKDYEAPKRKETKETTQGNIMQAIYLPDGHIDKPGKKTLLQNVNRIKKGVIEVLNKGVDFGAKEFLVATLGDLLNTDHDGKTTKGTVVGSSTNEFDAWKAGIDLITEVTDRVSQHGKTTLRNVPGNHDYEKIQYFNEMLKFIFKNNKQVDVAGDAMHRQYHKFGSVLIGLDHGHLVKPKQLAALMVQEFDQSGIKHRERNIGHRHKQITEDFSGISVNTLGAVGSKNEFSDRYGIDSRNDVITSGLYDKKHGKIATLYQNLE